MSPAAAKSERSLRARVEIAQAHADPDIRALAEAVLAQIAEVEELRDRVERIDRAGDAVLRELHERVAALEAPGDGK